MAAVTWEICGTACLWIWNCCKCFNLKQTSWLSWVNKEENEWKWVGDERWMMDAPITNPIIYMHRTHLDQINIGHSAPGHIGGESFPLGITSRYITPEESFHLFHLPPTAYSDHLVCASVPLSFMKWVDINDIPGPSALLLPFSSCGRSIPQDSSNTFTTTFQYEYSIQATILYWGWRSFNHGLIHSRGLRMQIATIQRCTWYIFDFFIFCLFFVAVSIFFLFILSIALYLFYFSSYLSFSFLWLFCYSLNQITVNRITILLSLLFYSWNMLTWGRDEHGKAVENDEGLQRNLSNRHLQMIAIGGSIGTGLFVGSGTRWCYLSKIYNPNDD